MQNEAVTLPSPTPQLQVFREGATGWLVINRPERRNALSCEIWRAVPGIIRNFAEDRAIRNVAIRGAGEEAFSAGADIMEFAVDRDGAVAARAYDDMTVESFEAIQACPKPVIAVIRGFCLGGGLALALSCDLRIAADTAVFAIPAARLGLAYPLAGLRPLLAAVSPAKAKEILFTARRIDGIEALRIGLVHMAVPAASLMAETAMTLALMEQSAPLSIMAAKRMINALTLEAQGPREDELARLAAACYDSDDYREGRQAFLDKRRPTFSGR